MDLGREQKIDLKLLALINNDVFIKGTRNLEGAEFEKTITYLQHFLQDKKNASMLESIFNKAEDKQNLDLLAKRVASLSQANKELDDITKTLNQISASTPQHQKEDAIELSINKKCQPLVSRIMDLTKPTTSSPTSVLMPGGWSGLPGKSGHAIIYEFKKDKNGNYIFLVYNSGAGLGFHENVTSADKERYRTVKSYKIPSTATEAELNYFVSELVKPNALPIVQGRDHSKIVEYDANILYEEVFRKISYLKGEEIPLQDAELGKEMAELASVGQRSGTCAEKVLQELAKLNVKDKAKSKAFIFGYKLYSIEEFITQHEKSMDSKKISQLKLAAQNLSKLLLKQKNTLPEEVQVRATKILEKTKVVLESKKRKIMQSQTLTQLDTLAKEKIIPEDIGLHKEPAVFFVTSPEKVIKKTFKADSVGYLDEIISSKTLNLNKLEEFKKEIESLQSRRLYKDAEQALFNYFTKTPLDKNYFSTIKNAAEAIQYVELTNYLSSKYVVMAAYSGATHTSPKESAVMLNVAESLDLMYQNNAVKIVDNSGFDSILHADSKKRLIDFKKSRRNNVYLSTDIPEVDKRTKEILERESYASPLDFDAFMDYINKNTEFKNHLISLFDKKRSPDIFDEELKEFIKAQAGSKQNSYSSWLRNDGFKNRYSRTESDRKAIAAFFRYFNEKECGEGNKFKNELDKLNLFKKMKACISNIGSTTTHLDISGDNIFNPSKSKNMYSNMMEYDEGTSTTIGKDFSIDNNLNGYFTTITDQQNSKPFGLDKESTIPTHKEIYQDNEIFFYPEGVKVEGDKITQSEYGRLHQELMHLRTAPDLQIMTTVDYFKDKLHLFANKITEGENNNKVEKQNLLQNDMQQYLRRNLLQPGLLLKEFERNPDSYEVINENFLNKGILYFTKNKKINNETLFFYDALQDVNQYALKSPHVSDKRKYSIFTEMAISYKELNELDEGGMTEAERYELSKVKLKMRLNLLDYILNDPNIVMTLPQKEGHYKALFNAYMNFCENARSLTLNVPEKSEQLRQLKYLSIERLKIEPFKNKVFDWALEYSKDKTKDDVTSQKILAEVEKATSDQKIIDFPYVQVKNKSGDDLLAVDLLDGLILIDGSYLSYPPDTLANSLIYKSVYGDSYPKMSVSIINKTNSFGLPSHTLLKKYEILGSNKTERFIELDSYSTVKYVYQKSLELRGESKFFEKRFLSNNQSPYSLMVRPQRGASLDVSLNLPESFYSSETECWVACDNENDSAIYIEKLNGKYVVDKLANNQSALVKELDENKNETGYILSTNYQDPKLKSVLDVFKGFDHPQFTEVLFKPAHDANKTVEEVKIKFPRYNLELQGKFDAKEQKWKIHQKNNPNLILVHDTNIQINPSLDISNSLIFEDKESKQRFLYTPVQNYYVDTDEKHNENLSDTVYYQPKLDNLNISKRLLQGNVPAKSNSRPRMGLGLSNAMRMPSGATTYSHSEEFTVFPIDSQTQELKPATTEDKLHLAYLELINLQPEEALNSIRSILTSGGLKGTVKELDLIEKIFNRAPLDSSSVEINHSLRIESPEFVSVRTHILYLISDLYANKKSFSLPDLTKMEVNTADDFLENERLKFLQSFETSVPQLMHEHLNKSLNIHSATAKEMRLPKTLEYKMIPRLENGYSLGLLDLGAKSKQEIEMLSRYLEAPFLIKSSSPSIAKEKPEYWLIGKDKYGRNIITKINDMNLMNTLQFNNDIEKPNTVYISEEKNRELFLEIEAKGAHVHQSKSVPIQARYEHLKNWYRTRELAKISKKKIEGDNRKEKLEQKIKRKKTTDTYEKKVETKTIGMPLIAGDVTRVESYSNSADVKEYSFSLNEMFPNIIGNINSIVGRGDPKKINKIDFNIQDLHPNMKDEKFLERIIPILQLVKSTDSRRSSEKEKLKLFLENTLKASVKIRPEKQNSLIRNWAPSILTALNNPNAFAHINLQDEYSKSFMRMEWSSSESKYKDVPTVIVGNPNRYEHFVKDFLVQAYKQNSDYPIQIKDYQYYLKENIDISSKQFKTEKYVPKPIEVKPSNSYKNLLHEDFIVNSGLNQFYDEMQAIKFNTELEVDKLKIELDMAIRESLIKSQVELLEAKLKSQKNLSQSDLLILEKQLKDKQAEYQKDKKEIDQIKQKLQENLAKKPTDAVSKERVELTKKFKSATKEGKYQDTAEIKRQFDEKIGAVRNNEGEKIYHLSNNILVNNSTRDKTKETCINFISVIDPKLINLEKYILALANMGPKDLIAQQEYRRQLQSRKREILKLSDLNRLFVLADINEYKKITGLDDTDIETLHNQMADFVNLGLLKQQYNRIHSSLDKTKQSFFVPQGKVSEQENEIMQLGRTIATRNMISPTGHADIQFFQKEEDILITPLQKFYLDKLLNKDEITDEYRNEVIQLIMGGGKSKVLGPLSMLKKADGTNLAIFQVKNSLLETNYADMRGNSKRLFNQDAVMFKFDRNSPSSSKDLKALFNLFHKTSINKGYIVTSGTSLQSLELKYLETLNDIPENTNPKSAEFLEWHKQLKWFERSLDFLKNKGDRIIDEVHDELDPNKELNYTLGDAVPPTKEDIKLVIDIFYFLREVPLGKTELGIDKEVKAIDLIHNNKFITDPKTQMTKIMDKIASSFVNNLDTNNTNPLSKIISKLDLKNDTEKQSLKEYLLNKNADIIPLLKSKLTERELMDIAFVKSEVSKFLPVTLLKNYNENYGPSRVEGLQQIKRKLAIPYTDLNTPNERSRFGEFTESLNYTVQMNLIEPISTELVVDLLKEYIEKAQTEQVDSLDSKFEMTSASIEYNAKFEKVAKPSLEQIKNYLYDKNDKLINDPNIIAALFFNGKPTANELENILSQAESEQANVLSITGKVIKLSETKISKQFDIDHRLNKEPSVIKLEDISKLNKKSFDCLVSILTESENFKKVMLGDYILKQVENNPIVLTSNSQDSGAMTKTTQAMSGTPHNFKSYHSDIYFDEAQGLGTDGETISLLKNKKTPVVDSSAYESVTGLLDEYLNNSNVDESVRKNTRAIIDIGALFKKEKSNFGIANKIGNYCKANPEKFSSEIKYVIYCENQGDVLHAWDIKNNKKIKLSSSDEKEISKILNCKPEERFTFYDQARITGTDIVQASGANKVIDPTTKAEITFSANAVVTFSEKTTKSAFLQGVKRMRQFHNKQTVSVIKADYLKERLPKNNDIDEVLAFVNQVQVDKALQLHFKSTGHKFKNALRSNFMDKIRNQETDPIIKHNMLEIFKPIFNKNYQPNHFLNHGAVETEQDAILYFPIMAEKYYDQWERLLDEAGIIITDQEKEKMKAILDNLSSDAIDICEKTFKSKPIERIDAEMVHDDNLGNEVENELQNELEIQIEKELELEKEIIVYDKTRQKFTPSNFELNNGTLAAHSNLYLVNKQVINDISFDDNIFMTAHQRQTTTGTFHNYYDQYVKPFHVVMMLAEKNKPETLQCVILTKEEAQAHITREKTGFNYNIQKDVWFVSSQDTLLHGKKPEWLKPKDESQEPKPTDLLKYNRTLEQVRYINGDLNSIMQQKHGLTWLSENAQTKLDYISNTILKRFPESIKYYRNLKSRLDVTSKIFNYMQTHPFDNYLDDSYNWDKISKGFSETADAETIAKIKVFASALHEVNTIHENNYLDSKLTRAEIDKRYEQQIAYRINQHKESFLDKRTKVIEAFSQAKPLDFVISDLQFKDIKLDFLIGKKTIFEIALNNNSTANLDAFFAKNKIKWTQKNGENNPKTNAELVVLHAIKKEAEGKNIGDTVLEIVGGKSKDADKVSKLVVSKSPGENLLILAVKHNNLSLLNHIESEYLSSFSNEKDLKDILKAAQKHITTETHPEINKLIQTKGKDGDLIEKHKRLRTVVFDKIEKWVDSNYEEKSKLDFSKRPFSVAKVDFDNFTQEDKDFVKSVVDKVIINPEISTFEFLNKKNTLSQPKMLEKNTALTNVISHSEKLLDSDLNKIITILIQNQAEVKSAFALALESDKSNTVLGHLKNQSGVDIYFDPNKPLAQKEFLLLRNYDKDSTEEIVRKLNAYNELNANLSATLDHKGNAIIHNLSTLEKNEEKLEKIISTLSKPDTFDINTKNSAGSTALHMAISNGNLGMIKSLLAQKDSKKQDKVDIDIADANDKTAMDLIVDELQKDESFNPEIVNLITQAYQRKHEGNYLPDVAVESMLTNDIWDYLNEKLSIKDNGFKDKTIVNKIIHANSRNEAEFNIHKSELYKRLNLNMDDKLIANYMDYIELYDNVQFDKNILGFEQEVEDFDAPKLAEIKKEKTEKFPDKWSRGDVIAIHAFREVNTNLFDDSFSTQPKIVSFISGVLDKQSKTIEEFYEAKKIFTSYIKNQSELPEDDAVISKQQSGKILEALGNNPHKLIPSYKKSEIDKPAQAQSQEYTVGQQTQPEKDWSRLAYNYLADIIPSGIYLNKYNDIPFNEFISGNTSTQEEFDKLKAETKKYLNLIFQDTIQEKEFVIGALDKTRFKPKMEEKAPLPSGNNIDQPQAITPDTLAEGLFDKIQSLENGFDNSNLSTITEYLHEIAEGKARFNEVKNALRELVGKKELANQARVRRMILGINWDQDFLKKIAIKREAEELAKVNEAKKLEASQNQPSENANAEASKAEAKADNVSNNLSQKEHKKLAKQYEKNYTVIAKEIFNYGITFTNNYEKTFNAAYKIKLKEQAKTTEDFDEINSELKILFKKNLSDDQSNIATQMLNSVKASDLNLKASAPKIESASKAGAKTGPTAPVTSPQTTNQQPKPNVGTTQVVSPPVQPASGQQPIVQPTPSASVPISTPADIKTTVTQPSQPQGVSNPVTSPVVTPQAQSLSLGAKLIAQLENYLPNQFEQMQELDKKIKAELKRLAVLKDVSPDEIKDLNNAHQVVKSYLNYKKLIDEDYKLVHLSKIPQEVTNILASKMSISTTTQTDKDDFNFASKYLEKARNIFSIKIQPSLLKLDTLLRSGKAVRDEDLKLYELYMNDLEKLYGEYKQFEDVQERHKFFNNIDVSYTDEDGKLRNIKLLNMISRHHDRVLEIEKITTESSELIGKISQADRIKLFPNKINSLTHFENMMTLLKDKSAIAATQARDKRKAYELSATQPASVINPNPAPVVSTQQEINKAKQERVVGLLKDLEPLAKEMAVIQQKLQQARNIHDFTDFFGKQYQELLIPLDNKYKLSSILGVDLDAICNEVLSNPLSQLADNKQDIANMVAAIKSSGNKIVDEIKLSLSDLLIRSWSFAKQLPPEKNEKENIILLLKDNVLAAGGCLPGIGARLVSAYSSCLRESLDTELYNSLQSIDFDDVDAEQKSRLLTNSALDYVANKTNNFKATPLKQGAKNPDFKVEVDFLNTLLHAHSKTEDEFYKNKLVLLKTIYQKMSPSNPQKRHEFDTVKMMFDLVNMNKAQLGKGAVPSDFALIKASDKPASSPVSKKSGENLQAQAAEKEKNELLKGYNSCVIELERIENDIAILQYLDKKQHYKEFVKVFTSTKEFYDKNKSNRFFADSEKINLEQKVKNLDLARTNFLISIKSDIEDKIVSKPQSNLEVEKKQFEQLLIDLNDQELIHSAFEQNEKDELITKIKDKIQSIDKLINPITLVTPPAQPSQSAAVLNFDSALHCKASAWHNNCALNCLTHYLYSKLESNGVQDHFNNHPAYNLLRESFKDYYNLKTVPSWEQIKAILSEYSIAHDREAVMAPVFRKYLSKIIVKEQQAIWDTEATAGISEFLHTGRASDVASTIINVNITRLNEIKKIFDNEVRSVNPALFTQQEKENAKAKMKASNETQEAISGKRRIKDLNNDAEVNNQIAFEKINDIEEKYNKLAQDEWNKKDGFAEKYAAHMEQLSKAELVSVNQLGLIATELGIGLEVFTNTEKYNMGADVRPSVSQDWVLKVYNPSRIHWEYEEPTQSKTKTIQHNNDYTEINQSVFHTYGSIKPMADEEIKKAVVQKMDEKGLLIQPKVSTGAVQPNSASVASSNPVKSPQTTPEIAQVVYERIISTSLTIKNASPAFILGRLHEYALSEQQFNDIKQEFIKLISDTPTKKLISQMTFDPSTVGFKAVQSAANTQQQPLVSTTQPVPTSGANTPKPPQTSAADYSWPASLIAEEILNQVIADTEQFAKPNIPTAIFADKINLYARNRVDFDRVVDILFGKKMNKNQGRIYFSLDNLGIEENTIRNIRRLATDTTHLYKAFDKDQNVRKAEIEKLRETYQNSRFAKTLFDADSMALKILTNTSLETDDFQKEVTVNMLSDKLNEYIYTKPDYDAVIEALLGTASKKGEIDSMFNTNKQEDIDISKKIKELLAQVNFSARLWASALPTSTAVAQPNVSTGATETSSVVTPNSLPASTDPVATKSQQIPLPDTSTPSSAQPVPVSNPVPPVQPLASSVTQPQEPVQKRQEANNANQAASNGASSEQAKPQVVIQPVVTQPTSVDNVVPKDQAVSEQTEKPSQGFLPGYSAQSESTTPSIISGKKPNTPEQIAEILFNEIIEKIPDGFDAKNVIAITNLIHQHSGSQAEFNEVKNALRESVSQHEVPKLPAVRRMLLSINWNSVAVVTTSKPQAAVQQQSPLNQAIPNVPPVQTQAQTPVSQSTIPPKQPSVTPPIQPVPVNNPVSPIVTAQPQEVTNNQATPNVSPVQTLPQMPVAQSTVLPKQPSVTPPTQPVPVNNPVSPTVTAQPQVVTNNQATPNVPPVQAQPQAPVAQPIVVPPQQSPQAFVPGFSAQSGNSSVQSTGTSVEPKTPEEISEILFNEIIQKIPDGFEAKNAAAISNLIHQNSSSEADFNEVKNALRECVSQHEVPKLPAVRRMLLSMKCNSATLNPAAKVKRPGF